MRPLVRAEPYTQNLVVARFALHFHDRSMISAQTVRMSTRMLQPHAVVILPYRGLGTGIPRALQDWPWIQLADDGAANQSRVVMQRLRVDGITGEVTPRSHPPKSRGYCPYFRAR